MNLAAAQTMPDAHRQLASLPHPIVLLEPGLRIASANPAAEQFFGQSLRRLAGRRLAEVLRFGEHRLGEMLSDSETPVSARDIVVEIEGLGPRRIDLTVSPVADSPGWQLLFVHSSGSSDVFGEDAGMGPSAFLQGPEIIAHEIKNPLAGIRGAAQLLGRKASRKEQPLVELITSEVDRIATLIEQMQKLSGKTVAPVEPCNLHEAIRRAIALFDAADGPVGQQVRIDEEFDPSLPPVLGSPDGLVQILVNLLSNAREACAGTPKARIMVRTRFASGLQLHSTGSGKAVRLPIELRVSDNGPGIDPAMREHIFEPFVTTKKAGQGLGLPLVRRLVRDMNGRIAHEREEAKGLTHFRIHLPLAQEQTRFPPPEMAS